MTVSIEDWTFRFLDFGYGLLESGGGYFPPQVLPFFEDGPKSPFCVGMATDDPKRAAHAALAKIAAEGHDWRGYFFMTCRVLPIGGRESQALVLEVVHDGYNPVCLYRRYDIDRAGRPRFIDEVPCTAPNAPPDRRLARASA